MAVGSLDNVIPTYNQNEPWKFWNINDIFDGTVGTNKFVPKVNDWVGVTDNASYYVQIVTSLSSSLIPSYQRLNEIVSGSTLTEADILFGVGPGSVSDAYRVYLNTNVMPYTLTVDRGLFVGGSTSSFAQIVKDARGISSPEPENSPNVVSAVYNTNGTYLTNRVSLELASQTGTNYTLKNISACNSITAMPDNEILTVIVFSAAGHVVYKRELMVENTSYIKPVNASTKHIVSLTLESPFKSITDDKLIQVPVNVPTAAMDLFGVITYSDGTRRKRAIGIDGFSISGLDQFVASYPGYNFQIVLNYTLKDDGSETATSNLSSDGTRMSVAYNVRTIAVNNTYGIKLYAYPIWNITAQAYVLEWYMYNLDRNVSLRVTDGVRLTGVQFNPTAWNTTQRLSVSLNFNNAVPGYTANYIHTQSVDVYLKCPPFNDVDHVSTWKVGFNESLERPLFGDGLYIDKVAITTDTTTINLASDIANQASWITRLYRQTYPVYNTVLETQAPEPTHFTVSNVNSTVTTGYLPVTQWSSNIVFGANLPSLTSLIIKFYKRTSDGNYLSLSAACMVIRP